MVKSPWYDDNGMKKGAWSEDEDERLRAYVSRYGHWNWRQLPKFAGLRRCGKSCRLRWLNYLRPGVKHGNYSKEEEDLIVELHEKHGNKWSIIASHLPGRTDNEIKNYWNTNLNRQGKNKIAPPQSKESDRLNGSSGDKANNKAHDLEPTAQENATFDHCYSLEPSSVESAYQYRQWVTSLEQSSVESLREDIACSSDMVEDPRMMDGDFWTQPFLEDKYLFMTNDNDDVIPSFLDEEGLLFPYASYHAY